MNFKKAALSLVTAAVSFSMLSGFASKPKPQHAKDKPTASVEYDLGNTVTIRGPIDGSSVSKAVEQIALSKSDEVFLFIQSPGGSVIDGMTLVNFIRSTEKKVVCVADVAISMAFVIFQACDERLTTANSITMQHHASFGAGQNESPNVVSFVKFLIGMGVELDTKQAARIGISLEQFRKNIDRDWWLFGDAIPKANVSDRVVTAVCTRKLLESEVNETLSLMGGLITLSVVWNGCPEILEPKSVKMVRQVTDKNGFTTMVAVVGQERIELEQQVFARRFVSSKLNITNEMKTVP